MDLKDKIIVITGGGGGIGRAMGIAFAEHGAKHVVFSDIDLASAAESAAMIGGSAYQTDVSKEDEVKDLIESVERDLGPIDLFCSNAGIGAAPDLASDNSEWQLSWDVNVMAHVYAARHMVPKMQQRGGGYFLHTASAAGLLNQLGGAAYGVTKHAAVGFAEWLAMTYAHEGIKVSVLCPQAVRTAMTANANESTQAAATDGMMEPEQLAKVVVEQLAQESFLILPHSEVLEYMRRKTADYDRWIGGMNRLWLRLKGAP